MKKTILFIIIIIILVTVAGYIFYKTAYRITSPKSQEPATVQSKSAIKTIRAMS